MRLAEDAVDVGGDGRGLSSAIGGNSELKTPRGNLRAYKAGGIDEKYKRAVLRKNTLFFWCCY